MGQCHFPFGASSNGGCRQSMCQPGVGSVLAGVAEKRANLDHKSRKIRYVPAYNGQYGQEARKLGLIHTSSPFSRHISHVLHSMHFQGYERMISATGPRSIQVGWPDSNN